MTTATRGRTEAPVGPVAALARQLAWLDGVLAAAIDRGRQQRAQGEFRGVFISEAEVDDLLDQAPLATAPSDPVPTAPPSVPGSRLDRIIEVCGLGPFEAACLFLAVAPHLDRRYGRLCAYLQDDLTKPQPTVGLALDLFAPSIEAAARQRANFGPGGRLTSLGLCGLGGEPSQPLIGRPLRVDEVLVSYLMGEDAVAAAIGRLVERTAPLVLAPEAERRLEDLAAGWRDAPSTVLCLAGDPGTGRRTVASRLARTALGRPTLYANSDLVAAAREALLRGAVLCVADADWLFAREADAVARETLAGLEAALTAGALPLIITVADQRLQPSRLGGRPVRSRVLPPPGFAEQVRLWQLAAVRADIDLKEAEAELLASTYRLSGGQIEAAVRRAQTGTAAPALSDLLRACRTIATATLGRLGNEIAPRFDWSDLVLPADVEAMLREIVTRVRLQPRLFEAWGFDQRHLPARGLSALFAGPSGTGKTMSAEVIAKELALPLYRVDLSMVVSKYIGETEKNLAQVFDEAAASGAILFFDEADALFGRRSEVRDSHDRYANVEVSYLLQRVEAYDGIVILATNLRQNIDEAFARRLHATVDFPFPDTDYRKAIWRHTFPAATPLAEDVDFALLARRYRLSGGSIRNAVITAAFLAAAEPAPVAMRHLHAAVRRENQKLGKLLAEIDDTALSVPTQPGGNDAATSAPAN